MRRRLRSHGSAEAPLRQQAAARLGSISQRKRRQVAQCWQAALQHPVANQTATSAPWQHGSRTPGDNSNWHRQPSPALT